jgi:hypothetical protein
MITKGDDDIGSFFRELSEIGTFIKLPLTVINTQKENVSYGLSGDSLIARS